MRGIPAWARVGAKVICVNVGPIPEMNGRPFLSEPPPVGMVCSVAAISADPINGCVTLVIAGWPNVFLGHDNGWSITRFRPVRTLETDISEHFAQYLKTPSHQRELAE